MARKILIVLKNLKASFFNNPSIKWDSYECDAVDYVFSIFQARAYFGEHKHDLIISEWTLSDGTWEELIEHLKKLSPSVAFVIIGNKDDYNATRLVFKAGAFDYLLKASTTPKTINDLLVDFSLSNNAQLLANNWRKEMKYVLGGIRDHTTFYSDTMNWLLQHSELNILDNPYRLIFVRMDNIHFYNLGFADFSSEKRRVNQNKVAYSDIVASRTSLEEQLISQVTQILSAFEIEKFCTKDHSILIIIKEENYHDIYKLLLQLQIILNNLLNEEFSIYLSTAKYDRAMFFNNYIELLTLIDKRFYYGNNVIIHEEDIIEQNKLDVTKIFYMQYINVAFQQKDFDKIKVITEEMFEYFTKLKIEKADIIAYIMQIIEKLRKVIISFSLPLSDEIFENYVISLRSCETNIYLEYEFLRIMRSLADLVKDKYINRNKRYVHMIEAYIEDNIDKKLSVEDLSIFLNMSSEHISRLFKKETNKLLSDYIYEIKMEAAKKLLLNSKILVKEVACSVGYDQLYFNKLFKKYTQLTPKEYQRLNKK